MKLNPIQVGTIIVGQDLLFPEAIRVESQRYSDDWRVVEADQGIGLGRKIRPFGWNFFFMAEQINVTVFGAGGAKTLAKAVNRLLGKVKSQAFNSVEITKIASRRFLGIPYLTLAAHARHIQIGPFLKTGTERKRGQRAAEWARS